MQADPQLVGEYLRGLQQRIVAAVEAADGGACVRDAWEKAPDEPLQGSGLTCILEGGALFERAGCGFSQVRGPRLPPSATQHRPELSGAPFEAMGVSLVFHPRNPHVPTVHMNVRMLAALPAGGAPVCWFGGGMDLTPIYGVEEDAVHFHRACRDALAPFGDDKYPRFKQWCDEYFFLKHRNEQRGVGGIFFDDFSEFDFERSFAMMRSVGAGATPPTASASAASSCTGAAATSSSTSSGTAARTSGCSRAGARNRSCCRCPRSRAGPIAARRSRARPRPRCTAISSSAANGSERPARRRLRRGVRSAAQHARRARHGGAGAGRPAELRIFPTGQAWHKSHTPSRAQHRLAMAQLAFGGIPGVVVDPRETLRDGPTYTLDTLRELRAEQPEAEWVLIMGSDQAAALPRWHGWQEILAIAVVCVAERLESGPFGAASGPTGSPALRFDPETLPGLPAGARFEFLELPPAATSATDIRSRSARGQDIAGLVPPAVERYIERHHLYAPA
jgi:coproporphyrinogen III oxidase